MIVQIPYLKARRRNDLEQLLAIFDQSKIMNDGHVLEIPEDEVPERYREGLRRLARAVSDKQVRDTMDVEDEMLDWMLDQERLLAAKDKDLEAKDKGLAEQAKALDEERQALAAAKQRIAKLQRQLGKEA